MAMGGVVRLGLRLVATITAYLAAIVGLSREIPELWSMPCMRGKPGKDSAHQERGAVHAAGRQPACYRRVVVENRQTWLYSASDHPFGV